MASRLRSALAGSTAALVWGAQEPLDIRLFRYDYSDVAVLGKGVTRGPGWRAAGFALHAVNGALFGLAYHEARRRLPTDARKLALETYANEVRWLARAIGISTTIAAPSPELEESIAEDERALPEYTADLEDRNLDEPYRRKLSFVWRKLRNGLEDEGLGYADASELATDLDVIDRSLRANRAQRVADGRLAALRRRVELFGFHLAKLDVHRRSLRRARPRGALARRECAPWG